MIKVKLKHRFALFSMEFDRFPRKIKKKLLGKSIANKKLKSLLDSVTLGEPIKTMFERRDIKPYDFCHKCGCVDSYGCGNKAEYPEHWETFRCVKCNTVVGYIDNSPYIHALECKHNDYDPTF